MSSIRLDHVAIGAAKIADAEDTMTRVLGGQRFEGGPSPGFEWQQFTFGEGGRLEVLEPLGPAGFMHRFLSSRGPGIHHVTFDVPDLDAMCERVRSAGYDVVGYRKSPNGWSEAFLHPKQAHGIVIQLAQEPDSHGAPEAGPPAATRVLGVALRMRRLDTARSQFGNLLEGTESATESGLVFHWPDSPLRIAIEVDPDAEEGPLAIDLVPNPALPERDWKVPELGTHFRLAQ